MTWRATASSPFGLLCREFFGQFFASESGLSDHQVRVALVGVLVALVTPGFFISVSMSGNFEMAAIRMPALLEPLTQLLATFYISYAIVTVGVIAVLAWDALSFTRRDALVLGPLPIAGSTIVLAKLAALSAFLLAAALGISGLTAVFFAMVAASHQGAIVAVRQSVALLAATTGAAICISGLLVTARAIAGMVGRGRMMASLCQFFFVSALLCLIALAHTSATITPGRDRTLTAHLQPIPTWSPTNWFLGLHETIRGTHHAEFGPSAAWAVEWTACSIVLAVLATVVSYRRQRRLALAPEASTGPQYLGWLPRIVARVLVGRDPVGRATADFLVLTLLRNRAPHMPIAINAAIAVVMIAIGLSPPRGQGVSSQQLQTMALVSPLLLAYWTVIGLRASCYLPSEWPAAWTFRTNATNTPAAYRRAVVAFVVAFVGPPTMLLAYALAAVAVDASTAGLHSVFVLLLVIALAQFVGLTIDFMPFTRAYRPGHARLKTRWPWYLLGAYAFSHGALFVERLTWSDPMRYLLLVSLIVSIIAGVAMIGRRHRRDWFLEPEADLTDSPFETTGLDLASAGRA